MSSVPNVERRCFEPTCANSTDLKRCSQCKIAFYCGSECQKKDWPRHKVVECLVPSLKKEVKTFLARVNQFEGFLESSHAKDQSPGGTYSHLDEELQAEMEESYNRMKLSVNKAREFVKEIQSGERDAIDLKRVREQMKGHLEPFYTWELQQKKPPAAAEQFLKIHSEQMMRELDKRMRALGAEGIKRNSS